MSRSKIKTAKIGETFAMEHLLAHGYEILERNYRSPFGEIDLIAQQGKRIVFVEVKTRRSLKFGTPQSAVTLTKQKRISKVALDYLRIDGLLDFPCRFDVIAVFLSSQSELTKLQHIENAFEFQADESSEAG